MDTEFIGGNCPKCNKEMMQKMNNGLSTHLTFKACPHCGFAQGERDNGCTIPNDELWNIILKQYNCKNREELVKILF